MAAVMLYERVHYRHDPRWLLSVQEGAQLPAMCFACVIEMAGDVGVSVVRRKHALFSFHSFMRKKSSKVIELLTQDGRVCNHFIETLLGMLQSTEDGTALDVVIEILVQLIVDLKLEQFLYCVLDECHKQLSESGCMRAMLPVFTLLGKLLDSISSLAHLIVTEHFNIVDHLPQGLMYPNELVKASVCYVYGKLYSSPTSAEKLAAHFTDKLCGLFLATLENAQTKELQINCMGFLKQLLSTDHFVSVIMSESGSTTENSENTPTLQAQNPLPLVLKKLLLSGEETLQIASAQCIAAVLVHSTAKYAPAFIHADIPEFLFENLMSTSEILIWSLYCCLLLMAEERLFFSKCHTVYGIESVVRSLQDVLLMNNMELHKQGLLLLAEILRRQPTEIKLFTNPGIYTATSFVLQEAVSCPVLEVATEAVSAASAFLRKDHLSTPVQYLELQKLVSKLLERCVDLPPLSRRVVGHQQSRDQVRNVTRQGQFLVNALKCFHNACRLALECRNDPSAQENAFTAPSSESKDTLESFSSFLLNICDSLCIPTVMKYYERIPVPTAMEIFFSVLHNMFAVVPNMKATFSKKLASTSFIRLALEMKSSLCSGQRYHSLNQACSDFLCSLSCNLWRATMGQGDDSHYEVTDLLQRSLIHLSGSISESLSLLLESPDTHSTDEALRCRQHALLIIFSVAYDMEDKFVPETDLFVALQGFLHSVQSQGVCLPPYVFRAVLHLLAICQEKCQALSSASLTGICRILETFPDIQVIYFHHPLFLQFFFYYPQLMDRFGHRISELWVSNEDCSHVSEGGLSPGASCLTGPITTNYCTLLPMLHILRSNPNSMLILLDVIVRGPVDLAHKVLMILKIFLETYDNPLVSDLLKSRLLQVLQRTVLENSSAGLQVHKNLTLTLSLMYLVQLKQQPEKVMGGTDFKLLNQVSSLCGKCSPCSVRILQPSFNYIYCCLHQASGNCRMRATALLLSNTSMMELIESILELTWTDASTASSDSLEALCSSAWLIASSLVCFQHSYSLEVHQPVNVDVDKMLNLISFRSKEKASLLIVSIILLLKSVLRQSFSSSVLTLVLSEKRDQSQPEVDVALQPLSTHSVRYLLAALQNFIIQKDILLVQVAISCLGSLLDFLYDKNKDFALHVVSQPWNQLVLFTSMSGADSIFLQPGILRLLMLFVKYENTNVVTKREVKQILDEATKLKLSDLPPAAAQNLHLFLQQLQNTEYTAGPAEKAAVRDLLKTIGCMDTALTSDILCVGDIAVSLSHVSG